MANATYNIQDLIVAKGLQIISNEMNFVKNIDHNYENKFDLNVEGHRTGPTIRIPKPARRSPTLRSGWVMNVAPMVEEVTSLTIDTPVGDDTAFDDSDLALLIPDPQKNIDAFGERFIKPRVSNIAAQVELDLFTRAMVATNNLVGVAGGVPQTSKTIADTMQKLNENLCPQKDRTFIMSAATSAGLAEALKGTFDKELTEEALMEGFISRLYNQKNYMSELTPTHTNGTFGTDTVVTQNSGSPQIGSSLITTGWTSTHGVAKGDIFTIAGVNAVNYQSKATLPTLQQFVVTAAATNSAGSTTISIFPSIVTSGGDQSVSAPPAINSALTFVGNSATAYRQNLAFHKKAFACAFAKMFVPNKGVEYAAQKTADGITMRWVRQFDIRNGALLDRIDVYYGFCANYPFWSCRVTE